MLQKVITIYCTYSSRALEIPFNEKTVASPGEQVIYKDSEEKEEFGVVQSVGRDSVDPDKILFTSRILRPASANDIQRFNSHEELSQEALAKCKGLIRKYGLDMQVFSSRYSFDGSQVMFMFTADERIDFRDLVKDLAKILQKQIYLRQIGPRDKAKLIGGFGKCGRSLCCSTFLGKLDSVNMEMVRAQSLESKGSSKLSGTCGKLLCCLKYEADAYRDLRKSLPRIDSIVILKKGVNSPSNEGRVIALDVLNRMVKLHFANHDDSLVVSADDIDTIKKVERKS
jgi:cell fate regulator YaaT (PSP1 superfamily)